MRTMASLDLTDDILIILGQQYHLVRLLPSVRSATLFLDLALDRSKSNLALAATNCGRSSKR
jgi:hypothetical protein